MNDGKNEKKYQKLKTGKKSSSMLSLNVSSLSKLRKLTGSSQEIIKKSVSESHVGQMNGGECDSSLDIMHNSIDELNEKEFNEGCDARINERLSPIGQPPNLRRTESKAEHEDSSLLNSNTSNITTNAEKKEELVCLSSKL